MSLLCYFNHVKNLLKLTPNLLLIHSCRMSNILQSYITVSTACMSGLIGMKMDVMSRQPHPAEVQLHRSAMARGGGLGGM